MKSEINENIKRVIVEAPGKLMILGEHAVVYGSACIVSAVNRHLRLTVYSQLPQKKEKNQRRIKNSLFLNSAISVFRQEYNLEQPIFIDTESELGGFGLGSSSAVVVAAVKGLSEYFNIKIKTQNLFDLCYKAVIDVQKISSGFDIASAIYGRTINFEGKSKKCEIIADETLPILVIFTGRKAKTIKVVEGVKELYKNNTFRIKKIFNDISNLVIEGRRAIIKKNWSLLGSVMNRNQELLRRLSVSTPKAEEIIEFSLKSGALGAKISGAGGGDCVILLYNPRGKDILKKKIIDNGFNLLDLNIGTEEGVKLL